jgi:hypothetical protein
MSHHKFKIGQRLFPPHSVGLDISDEAYVVVKRLPARNGEFEYQIKSVDEPHQRRVVRESQLRPNPNHPRRLKVH